MTLSPDTDRPALTAVSPSDAFSPREEETLWRMEERFWTSGVDSVRATTAADAVMVLPFQPGILKGKQIWTYLRRNTGWRSIIMAERRVMRSRNIAILTYRASAEKADVPIYKALCASTYLEDDETWLRISHQQVQLP